MRARGVPELTMMNDVASTGGAEPANRITPSIHLTLLSNDGDVRSTDEAAAAAAVAAAAAASNPSVFDRLSITRATTNTLSELFNCSVRSIDR